MNIQNNVPLAPFSTFRVGGSADMVSYITTKEDLQETFAIIQKDNFPYFILGGGSNVLFSDKGFRGVVLVFQNDSIFPAASSAPHRGEITVESGAKNSVVYQYAKKKNLDFAVFTTVPGTIGGAVFGNAGIPDAEIGDYVVCATVFNTQTISFETVYQDFFQFSYRSTFLHTTENRNKYIIWNVTLCLPELPEDEIQQKAKDLITTRKEKQPWGLTGGSFFKNPSEGAAGYFLDQVGAKKMRVGGAYFSEKHANFMMNDGNATQKNIITLAKKGAAAVQQTFNVQLIPEVRILDEHGNTQDFY